MPAGDKPPTGHLRVNGQRVPLVRVDDRLMAGIRFRAFYLVPALHPHISAHAPLTLEWIDNETLTVLSAAMWHVWHPMGGRYAGLPQTEGVANRRLRDRWVARPEHRGQRRDPVPDLSRTPAVRGCTLDLRHCRTA